MRAALFLLAACSSSKPEPAKPAPVADRMDTFTINGYLLAGAEYWPYTGADEIKYPDAVLWGFYPKQGEIGPGEDTPNVDTANPKAVECARTAYDALRAFVQSDPPKLRRIIERGADKGFVPRFYLWTNDYTHAATPYPPGVREARLWYWKRKEPAPPKPPGYWKWESTLTQSGECQIPQAAQIEQTLTDEIAKL
jgi:hypothetical protein